MNRVWLVVLVSLFGTVPLMADQEQEVVDQLKQFALEHGDFPGAESGYIFFSFPITPYEDTKLCDEARNFFGFFGSDDNVLESLSARAYKIHLMPRLDDLVAVVKRLDDAIRSDAQLAQRVERFKVNSTPAHLMHEETRRGILPTIVIYQNRNAFRDFKTDAQQLVELLDHHLAGFEGMKLNDVADYEHELVQSKLPAWSPQFEGVTPRFNVPYNNLIFYAIGGADDKLDIPGLLSFFDAHYNYAIPKLGPEKYLLHSPYGLYTVLDKAG